MSVNIGEILVIDDESNSLALLASILSEEGYQVRPADSGTLALASVEISPPELILLDMWMPGMDGLEVCRQLKARNESVAIPILFVSGSMDTEARVEALELGAVDFVTKPFNRAELLARVRTHLDLSRLRSKLEEQVAKRTEQLHRTVEQLQQEIADRLQAEHALRESEQRFRVMADNAPVMIATTDATQHANFFNKVWLDFTGRTMEQELGDGWITSVHPDDIENCLGGLSKSFAGRTECNLEYRLRRADGEYRSLLCKGVPLFQPDGKFAGYIGSMTDITEFKRNHEIVEKYKQQLQELTANLISGQENANRQLARDLHDVLSQEIVSLSTEIFAWQDQLKSDGELARGLSDLGKKLARLANDIHRTSHALHPAILEDLGLKPALADVCDAFQTRSGIPTRFTGCNVPAELPRDVSLCLYRVAQESLRNIGKHAVSSSKVQVLVSGSSEGVVLRIEDNGNGFLFEDAHKKRGLGLISMKERVRMVNGSFSLHSEPGKGTTVEAIVPIGNSNKERAEA